MSTPNLNPHWSIPRAYPPDAVSPATIRFSFPAIAILPEHFAICFPTWPIRKTAARIALLPSFLASLMNGSPIADLSYLAFPIWAFVCEALPTLLRSVRESRQAASLRRSLKTTSFRPVLQRPEHLPFNLFHPKLTPLGRFPLTATVKNREMNKILKNSRCGFPSSFARRVITRSGASPNGFVSPPQMHHFVNFAFIP